ncbi:hypothetical protein GX865_00215 [Candidatus Saccharibacteria bacterium]|jgi:hypothetical protein|nr:hypothetical protein [Candidatus Saccharibacteria bacterium]
MRFNKLAAVIVAIVALLLGFITPAQAQTVDMSDLDTPVASVDGTQPGDGSDDTQPGDGSDGTQPGNGWESSSEGFADWWGDYSKIGEIDLTVAIPRSIMTTINSLFEWWNLRPPFPNEMIPGLDPLPQPDEE